MTTMIEADLHELVDGQIDAARRVTVLQTLAASPREKAQFEAWQAQGDLLRSAFVGVDREPVPPALALKGRPQLHCVPADDAPLVATPARSKSRRRDLASLGGVLIVAAGLAAGGWLLLNDGEPEGSEGATFRRGATDTEMARRSEMALKTPAAPVEAPSPVGLPTREIPDLHTAGFGFVGAEIVGTQPPTIVFRYQSRSGDRVVLSVARAPVSRATRPTPINSALSWRSGDKVFALAGTVDGDRLRTLASALQRDLR